jgi:hypothetical protein
MTAADLDGAVWAHLCALLTDPVALAELTAMPEHPPERDAIERDLVGVERKMANAAKLYVDDLDGHARDSVRAELNALSRRRAQLEERLAALPVARTPMSGQAMARISASLPAIESYTGRRAIVEKLGVLVTLYPTSAPERWTVKLAL